MYDERRVGVKAEERGMRFFMVSSEAELPIGYSFRHGMLPFLCTKLQIGRGNW